MRNFVLGIFCDPTKSSPGSCISGSGLKQLCMSVLHVPYFYLDETLLCFPYIFFPNDVSFFFISSFFLVEASSWHPYTFFCLMSALHCLPHLFLLSCGGFPLSSLHLTFVWWNAFSVFPRYFFFLMAASSAFLHILIVDAYLINFLLLVCVLLFLPNNFLFFWWRLISVFSSVSFYLVEALLCLPYIILPSGGSFVGLLYIILLSSIGFPLSSL